MEGLPYIQMYHQMRTDQKSCYYRGLIGFNYPVIQYILFLHKPWSKDPCYEQRNILFHAEPLWNFRLVLIKSSGYPWIWRYDKMSQRCRCRWIFSLPSCWHCVSIGSVGVCGWGFLQPEKMGAKTSHRGCPMVNISFDQCLIYLPLYIYYINGWFCVVKCG